VSLSSQFKAMIVGTPSISYSIFSYSASSQLMHANENLPPPYLSYFYSIDLVGLQGGHHLTRE